MLKERSSIVRVTILVIDALLMAAAFVSAYVMYRQRAYLYPINEYYWIVFFSVPLTLFTLYRNHLYSDFRFKTYYWIVFRCALSFLTAFLIGAAILYLTKSGYYSRVLTVSFFLLAFVFVVIEKMVLKLTESILIARGYNRKNVLVIGDGSKAEKLFDVIRDKKQWGIRIVETIDISECDLECVKEVMQKEVIDEVYISFSRDTQKKVDFESLILYLEKFGKTVRFVINLDEVVNYFKVNFSYIGDLPSLVFYSKTLDADQVLIKRIIDIFGSCVGLIITGILLPFVALAIKLESPGPVLFGQPRVGMNGRRFIAYKFRSMVQDAESRKKELMDLNTRCGPIFKIENDPRVTRVGKILRRTSLDEFPQFWNVLKGEMSLVGTRPPTYGEVKDYQEWHHRRVSIRPGLTGLWQVNGRTSVHNFDDIVKIDLEYIDNWSFWLDVKIIVKTIGVIVRCTGS